MKIIKVKDFTHPIFKENDELETALEIFRFEEPEGFMIIRRGDDLFRIRVSAKSEIKELEEIKKTLKPYMTGKVFMSIDVNQESLVEYIQSKNIKQWFGYYDMSIESFDIPMNLGEIKGYLGEDEKYNHILGKAFEPMRTLHGFEPYDWYGANPEEAKKEYLEADEKDNFYSYYIDDELVGVCVVIDKMIDVIGIEPNLQKKGYGREFLRGVINDMFNRNIDKIEIGVVESNQHVYKLYSQEGFKTNSHRRMYKNY